MVNNLTPPSFEEKIAEAEELGNIAFLQKAESEGKLDPFRISPDEKWNSLHRANIWNPSSPETIRFYIDKGVPVNAQDIYGMTPLHYAMRAENGDAAMVLLEAGADPNIETYEHKSIPLSMIGYAQLAYGFNYYGTVGSNRDEWVIVRKMSKVDWMDEPVG